jgi:hypothetical protein
MLLKEQPQSSKQSAGTFSAEQKSIALAHCTTFVVERPISVEQASSHDGVMHITGLRAIHR